MAGSGFETLNVVHEFYIQEIGSACFLLAGGFAKVSPQHTLEKSGAASQLQK